MMIPFTSSDMPMKNQIDTERCVAIDSAYQKIMLRITKIAATITAQKSGF